MAEVPVLQEQQTGRPPWMAEVPVLQEQQTGRLQLSDSLASHEITVVAQFHPQGS